MRRCFLLILLIMASVFQAESRAQDSSQEVTFRIREYLIEGNTLFNTVRLTDVLDEFTGQGKTAQDVEQARNRLERYYHDNGYPTVLVNIPEQSVEDGVIRLKVIEARIRSVRVTGNSYFTGEMIRKRLASLKPGKVLYIPDVQKELAGVNSISSDLSVTPMIVPGDDLSTVDVELKVEDSLPLHGSLALSNRGTHDTTDLRLNASMSYDNLWQKGHSASLQYQTAPEEPSEVQVYGGSYVLPAPWADSHIFAAYAITTDSETAFGEGFQTVGEGFILGSRYIIPLPEYKAYSHNVTFGLDYKDFKEDTELGEEQVVETPVESRPLRVSHSSTLRDKRGAPSFSLGVNAAFRQVVTDLDEFADKRSGAKGSYIYLTAGVERMQQLPLGFTLMAGVDGQIADQPLISNEQYIAGGMRNVRGYKESEESGDDALHWTLELSCDELAYSGEPGGTKLAVTPYVFCDGAVLGTIDPLPGQDEQKTLHSTGLGFRGEVTGHLSLEGALGVALEETENTDQGHVEGHFLVTYRF